MGLGERINAAILKRVRSEVPAQNGAAFLASFPEATRLVATVHDGMISDAMILLAELGDGRVMRIDEHDAHWDVVLAALDAGGRAAMTSTEWRLRLVGDAGRTPIELFVRQGQDP